MITLSIEWMIGIAAISFITVSVILAMCLLRLKKCLTFNVQQQQENQQLRQQLDELKEQLHLISKGALGVGKRLMLTEKRLNQTMERQDSLETREAEKLSFKQAAKLFERGLQMDNVIEKVGITRTEAKLVDMLQQKKQLQVEK